MPRKAVRIKRKHNGQFNGSESLNLGQKNIPTAARRLAIAGAGVAAVAMTLTGCGSAKSPVASPKLICYTTTPPAGFELASNAARLSKTTAVFPKVTGADAEKFGLADAQGAFEAGFSVIYNLNIIGKMWAPNLNKDPNFTKDLESQLRAYSPYFCGEIKTKFLASIPDFVNPTVTKKDAKGKTVVSDKAEISLWRGMFGIPERLPNGTLPPASKAADDLELVAPWSLAQAVGEPVVALQKSSLYPGVGQVIAFRFNWQNDLVYGTNKSIEWYQPLNRDVTIFMVKNPDAISAKAFPYVMVDFQAQPVSNASFGKMVKYVHPLVEPAQK
jgi:hypothetical protein